MRNLLSQLAPPKTVTDPFPAQWLRAIQTSGHPIFNSLLGGTWQDIYISDGWKISSDGVIRQGGHSIEFGIKVGKSITPLHKLPVMVQRCWPKLSIRIPGKSSPDQIIRIVPALFTDGEAAGGLAIELAAKHMGIAVRTRGLYSSSGTLRVPSGWSVIPPSPVAQRIVFSRTKPSDRMSQQFAHASSCVTCLDDSDIPSWLTAAIAPALQYSAMRPPWIRVLLGHPLQGSDVTADTLVKCQAVLTSGSSGDIATFAKSLDTSNPQLLPEVGFVLKWLIANHPGSTLDAAGVGSQLVSTPKSNTPLVRALAYAMTRIPLPLMDMSSSLTKEIRSGQLSLDPGQSAALFAAGGDVELASGAAFLVQPSIERQLNLLTPSEWLALLFAIPAGLRLSGSLAIDTNASTPFGVRSPILTSGFAGLLTSRKDIEANRVRISLASGSISLRSLRTWPTETTSASALCLHLGQGGRSTTVNATVDINQATRITFPKSEHIKAGESLVISTVGTT